MMVMGGEEVIRILQRIVRVYIYSEEKEEVKLAQFLLVEILPFSIHDEEFYSFYINFLVKCSKEQFEFANSCLLVVFCIDWRVSKKIFNRIITKLREEKGSSRLRHLEVFNNYVICSARFAQEEAKNGIEYLMRGIEEGTDEISELIVSMLIYCFIVPINIKLLPEWLVEEEIEVVLKNASKIYKLNESTGYNIN
jgi:hypothetical protein